MGPFFFNCYFSGAKCPVLNDLKRSFLNTQLIQPLRSQSIEPPKSFGRIEHYLTGFSGCFCWSLLGILAVGFLTESSCDASSVEETYRRGGGLRAAAAAYQLQLA